MENPNNPLTSEIGLQIQRALSQSVKKTALLNGNSELDFIKVRVEEYYYLHASFCMEGMLFSLAETKARQLVMRDL
jgi:hypothetical protein